ncbi:hypothetical protein HispidOSU_008518 [Sigmodon hispidus]
MKSEYCEQVLDFSSGHCEQEFMGLDFILAWQRKGTALELCGGCTNILESFSSVIDVSFPKYKYQIIC